jgi:ketosteroid isomerase-like protein
MRIPRAVAVAAVAFSLAGCVPMIVEESRPLPPPPPIAPGPSTERQIQMALQRYSNLIVAMDARAISEMYSPDGVLERSSGPLQGREAIRDALSSTGGVRVISNDMYLLYMSYNGPAVVQTGEFKQAARMPDGKTVNITGRFEATWIRSARGEWWIKRMVTRPNR